MARPPLHRKARILGDWTLSAMLQRGILPSKRAPSDRDIVLVYNTKFGWPDRKPTLPHGFELSTDLRLFPAARVVIFHLPSLGRIDHLEKPEGQIWVGRWKECETHPKFTRLADPEFMSRFDLTMSYRLDADIFNGYFNPRSHPGGEAQLQAEPGPRNRLAAAFISTTTESSGRTRYISELMKHMPVASFGRVLRNERVRPDLGRPTLRETLARFKFTLAFENSISEDYVTEKFYDALYAGSVPVYLGAPNIDRLAPADDCYVDVREFAGPRELAEHLLQLDADDEAYRRYLDWKTSPMRPELLALYEAQREDPIVRICELIAELDDDPAPRRVLRPSLQ